MLKLLLLEKIFFNACNNDLSTQAEELCDLSIFFGKDVPIPIPGMKKGILEKMLGLIYSKNFPEA